MSTSVVALYACTFVAFYPQPNEKSVDEALGILVWSAPTPNITTGDYNDSRTSAAS
jgi:hypothetical protein